MCLRLNSAEPAWDAELKFAKHNIILKCRAYLLSAKHRLHGVWSINWGSDGARGKATFTKCIHNVWKMVFEVCGVVKCSNSLHKVYTDMECWFIFGDHVDQSVPLTNFSSQDSKLILMKYRYYLTVRNNNNIIICACLLCMLKFNINHLLNLEALWW